MRFKNIILRHPAAAYFITTFALSWLGALFLVAPHLFKKEPLPAIDGIIMFPIMLLGPPVAAVVLTAMIGGKPALKELSGRMSKWKVPIKWYLLPVVIFPCGILITLFLLQHLLSPAFASNFFAPGFLFGIPAGFLEEIGWTGFAFPLIFSRRDLFRSGIYLGVIWALWHLPAIDFLGVARPHGRWLFPFFLSFAALLAAVRILIAWIYVHTGSVLLAQFTHTVSTGCLVLLGASHVTPLQEALWYAVYAALLWIVILAFKGRLQRYKASPQAVPGRAERGGGQRRARSGEF
jgi:membrane protease YdiL (CAAX protease family)